VAIKEGKKTMPVDLEKNNFPVDDYIAFHEKLAEARSLLGENLAKNSGAKISKDEALARVESKKNIIDLSLALPSNDVLSEVAVSLLDIATTNHVVDKSETVSVKKALTKDGLDLLKIVKAVISSDVEVARGIAKESNIALDTISFIQDQLARGVFTFYASQISEFEKFDSLSKQPTCPCCGNGPRFSIVTGEDEGARMLVCGMCETKWRYKRIGCPYCDSEDQKKLRRFTVEDEPAFSADVCDACKRYLKQVDCRKFGSDKSVVQMDAASSRFDVLARREGFR